MNRLTPVMLKKLPPGMHADGNGLYLDVQPSGSRSWILRTLVRRKRRDIGLGGLSTTSLAEAREEAAKLRARRERARTSWKSGGWKSATFPRLRKPPGRFIRKSHHRFATHRIASIGCGPWRITSSLLFGKKTVDTAIDSADVLRAILPIWRTKPDMARKTLARIRRVFDWATLHHHRDVMVGNITIALPNPCIGVRAALPGQPREGHHAALPYQELPELFQKIRMSPSGSVVKLATEFTILTCLRKSEVRGARWEEIDFASGVWTVPRERMKMEEEHRVPLPNRAIEILNLAKQFSDPKIVFPGVHPGEPLSNVTMLKALKKLVKVTVHGFRATFKTWAHEKTKFDRLVIEACLAHRVKGIDIT